MATLSITEYPGGVSYISGRSVAAPREPSLQSQAIATSASASTAALGGYTQLIELVTDVGAWVLFGSSASTGIATSTNAQRFLPNVAYTRGVSPYMRITTIST
jgi:hypothetical protein